MGAQDVRHEHDAIQKRQFITQLLHDVQALDVMIERGAIESGVRRIGAEQELFLVDQAWRPAPVSLAVLEAIDDAHFTTELGRFSLGNQPLDPLTFTGDCLSRLERDLNELLHSLRITPIIKALRWR
jgi:hypothetical protein